MTFDDAIRGLTAGDFTRLEPLFRPDSKGSTTLIRWHVEGLFAGHHDALDEAFTCACFLGADEVVDHLLAGGVRADGGNGTGMNAIHWAANRGQAQVVRKLIKAGAALESLNRFGGTVLGCAVWSLLNEPRPDHLQIIRDLLGAGALADAVTETTGDARVDELLARYRQGSSRG